MSVQIYLCLYRVIGSNNSNVQENRGPRAKVERKSVSCNLDDIRIQLDSLSCNDRIWCYVDIIFFWTDLFDSEFKVKDSTYMKIWRLSKCTHSVRELAVNCFCNYPVQINYCGPSLPTMIWIGQALTSYLFFYCCRKVVNALDCLSRSIEIAKTLIQKYFVYKNVFICYSKIIE